MKNQKREITKDGKTKMTDEEFLELYNKGLMDIEIAEILGVTPTAPFKRRKKLGLPSNPKHKRTAFRFKVYDHETKEFVMEGTVAEIDQKLYISRSTVRWYVKQTAAKMKCQYDVYEVKNETPW